MQDYYDIEYECDGCKDTVRTSFFKKKNAEVLFQLPTAPNNVITAEDYQMLVKVSIYFLLLFLSLDSLHQPGESRTVKPFLPLISTSHAFATSTVMDKMYACLQQLVVLFFCFVVYNISL